jgi:hypothetical protein
MRDRPLKRQAFYGSYRMLYLRLIACVLSVVALAASVSAATNVPSVDVMYVSDLRTAAISMFRLDSGRRIATIPYPMAPGGIRFSGGAGVAVDTQNHLYAAYGFDNGRDYPGKTVVYEYAPPTMRLLKVSEGWCCAAPQISLSSQGELAEALDYFPPYGGGATAFIEPGIRYVGRVNLALAGTNWNAYDADGTLWISGVDELFKPHFGYIPRHGNCFKEVRLDPMPRRGPVAIDSEQNVLVENDEALYVYRRTGELAYRATLGGAKDAVDMALSHDRKSLYVAKTDGTIAAYRYPSCGKPFNVYAVGGTPFALALGAI